MDPPGMHMISRKRSNYVRRNNDALDSLSIENV